MTDVNRRLLAFFRAGVPEVWVVCPEMETIRVVRPGRLRDRRSDYFPADFEQFVVEFFNSSTQAPIAGEEGATEAHQGAAIQAEEREGHD